MFEHFYTGVSVPTSITAIRNDFPFLTDCNEEQSIVYLDNAATLQKPKVVLDALYNFYVHHNANIHRSSYQRAEKATELYENARQRLAQFINTNSSEIVFTSGTTEGINLVAHSWGLANIRPGDEIVITQLEHHSNLLPWFDLARRTQAVVKIIPINEQGTITADQVTSFLSHKTKLLAITHTSHVTGAQLPLESIIAAAKQHGIRVLVDAAQAVAHQKIDVQKLGADFLVFSGHKMGGPTGIGVLYVNKALHAHMSPYQWGGGMVESVKVPDGIIPRPFPDLLEVGTMPIAQAVGLAVAAQYIDTHLKNGAVKEHESQLCAYLLEALQQIPTVHVVGPVEELKKTGHLVSFWIDGIHAHDAAHYLDVYYRIAVRAGNPCAQPLIEALGGKPLVRASFFWYNTFEEVDRLVEGIKQMVRDFA
jgi:cysteine desulfurase/selenocysteine lyase